MAQYDSFDDYNALTPPAAHEVDDLLDPTLDRETRQYFDRVKASFHLSELATQTFLQERSWTLRVREDPRIAHEYLDELKIKRSKQIVATVFRTRDNDGTGRVVFSKETELSDKTKVAYFEIIEAERAIAQQD